MALKLSRLRELGKLLVHPRGRRHESPVGQSHAHRDLPREGEPDRQHEAEQRTGKARERMRRVLRGGGRGFGDGHGEKRHGLCWICNGAANSGSTLSRLWERVGERVLGGASPPLPPHSLRSLGPLSRKREKGKKDQFVTATK